jgi:hypothetical protein
MKAQKTVLVLSILSLLVLSLIPSVLAIDTGVGITPDIETEDFEPLVWQCNERVVTEDNVETGRITGPGTEINERTGNYLYEGEMVEWVVLVMDKNGVDKVSDVFITAGPTQGIGNDIEANCIPDPGFSGIIEESCNARILEEDLTGEQIDSLTQRYYRCKFTAERDMYDEHFVTIEAMDIDGLSGVMAENEFWFLNPIIALNIDGDMFFENVRPGTQTYSETILVENDADLGSGVLLDMFISGTDFFDSSSSGAACPTSNVLALTSFDYFASQGAYSTQGDGRSDAEGYVPINYGDNFNDAPGGGGDWYGAFNGDPTGYEIIQSAPLPGGYFPGNVLAPGSELAVTFRLSLPEPCNGDFDSGEILFWGEAI